MDVSIDTKIVDEKNVTLKIRVASKELASLERGARMVVAQRNNIDIGGSKTAQEILDQSLGEQLATKEILEAIKKFIAPFALSLDGGDYSVVGAPTFDEGKTVDENGDLLIEAIWVRLQPMELSSCSPVEIRVPILSVSESEIDARIAEITDSFKTMELDGTKSIVEEGSTVQISMDCLKDGERLEQICFDKRLYRAGSYQMPEGFDEALVGAKVGDTVHVNFVLPTQKELDGSMSGSAIYAKIDIQAIMKEVTHELTDDFVAQNIPNANTMEDLRAQTRDEILQSKREHMKHFKNFSAAEELVKRIEGTISDEAYEAVASQMLETLYEQAHAGRLTVEEYLAQQGLTEDQFRMTCLMKARTQLRQGAALDAWARYRGISIDESAIDAFFASSAQGQGSQMRKEIENGGYLYLAREGALRFKAGEDLSSHAIIQEDASVGIPSGVEPIAKSGLV